MSDDRKGPFQRSATWIREQEVGRGTRIETPFGPRLLTYADLTASGRHLRCVERWIDGLRPIYANTHSEVSSTGRVVTRLREESRAIVRRGVNAGDEDEVLFVGNGSTGAVNKLVGLLGLRIPDPLERAYRLSRIIPDGDRPVVLVGPYEHHSNELPWLESLAVVEEVDENDQGGVDLNDLEVRLVRHSHRPLRIGSFSAASNVTGTLTDVRAVARVLHRHGAYAFFDYAAGGPYLPIDMHPEDPDERIDALFLSTHKFVGGPESSGVLVAHRSLFRTTTPEAPGGGTVDFVAGPGRGDVDYVSSVVEREESGTPAILGDIRAGAAFLVKASVGAEAIREHEIDLARGAVERLDRHPRIRVLGPRQSPRLGIISFTVDGLHHDLASILLDHLFGIQNRSGCSCAGPYGHRLLGIDRETSERFRNLIRRGINGIKPGWVRLSLPYYATPEDLDYLLRAAEFVADHGETFVPAYRLGWRDGVWQHVERPEAVLRGPGLTVEELRASVPEPDPPAPAEAALRDERERYFAEAETLAKELGERWRREAPPWNPGSGDPEVDALCWFRYVHADRL